MLSERGQKQHMLYDSIGGVCVCVCVAGAGRMKNGN